MKKIYICSPLRGDIERNIMRALDHCREAAELGVLPIAPHAYFTRFLDDSVPQERALGMEFGRELLRMCDEVWAYNLERMSAGMAEEIALARELGIPVLDAEAVYRQAHEDTEKRRRLRNVTIHIPRRRSCLKGGPDREPLDVVLPGSLVMRLAELLQEHPGEDLTAGRYRQ